MSLIFEYSCITKKRPPELVFESLDATGGTEVAIFAKILLDEKGRPMQASHHWQQNATTKKTKGYHSCRTLVKRKAPRGGPHCSVSRFDFFLLRYSYSM